MTCSSEMRKIFKDCLTEKNGETYDVVRVLGAFSFICLNIMAVVHMYMNCHDLDFTELATGMSLMLGTIAAGVTFKYTKE